MTEPINFQVNILQSQEVPRQAQANRDVSEHQAMAQEVDRAQESQLEPETVQTSNDAEQARLNKDGSGRGRTFQRRRRTKEAAPEETSENGETAPEDPTRGTRVDFMR